MAYNIVLPCVGSHISDPLASVDDLVSQTHMGVCTVERPVMHWVCVIKSLNYTPNLICRKIDRKIPCVEYRAKWCSVLISPADGITNPCIYTYVYVIIIKSCKIAYCWHNDSNSLSFIFIYFFIRLWKIIINFQKKK